MESFTYQETLTDHPLETYEWDNIWWEHADDSKPPRVLIVGDSISCGYRQLINKELNGRMYADVFGTSKALDNRYFLKTLENVLAQQARTDLIQINNGLHGWHLKNDDYEKYYRKAIDFIENQCKSVPLIVALTTPVRSKENLNEFDVRNQTVIERNEIAKKIAQEKGLIVFDFYSLIKDHANLYTPDGVHLLEEGYIRIAKYCAEQYTKIYFGKK